MLLEELLRCQIHEWYPAFRRHTIPTVILPLPAAFIRYLAGQPAYPDPDADADQDAEPLPFLLPALTSGRHPFPPLHAHLPDPVSLLDRDNSDLFFGSDDDDREADNLLRPAFPDLEAAIDAAIADLGGAALPKLNWSAPKDATFMSADATIRCTCFAEVAMLLRSSDCVAHDLVSARPSCQDFVRAKGVRRNATGGSGAEEGARPNAHESGAQLNAKGSGEEESDPPNVHTGARPDGGESSNGAGSMSDPTQAVEEGDKQSAADCGADDAPEEDVGEGSNELTWVDDGFQYYLALRKWYPGLRPESEFRCFVRGCRLVAVSQRDPSAYYPSLPGWSAKVQPKIEAFFEEVIEPQFALQDYTFDVYVRADERVKLIDFNPWGGYTLPLLFTWEELEEQGRGEEVKFRVVMQQGAVRPGLMTAVPYDMLDWGEGSGWDVFLKKADEELDRQMASLEFQGHEGHPQRDECRRRRHESHLGKHGGYGGQADEKREEKGTGSSYCAIYAIGGVSDFAGDFRIIDFAVCGCTNGALTEEGGRCPTTVFSTRPADVVPLYVRGVAGVRTTTTLRCCPRSLSMPSTPPTTSRHAKEPQSSLLSIGALRTIFHVMFRRRHDLSSI